MASSTPVKLTCALILCIIVLSAPHYGEAALSCGQVATTVAPCINYLRGGPGPTGPCCGGVTKLTGLAKAPNDLKTACTCLKSIAVGISGINYGTAAGLPSKCGVNLPYAVSPKTDCNKLH